MELIELKLYQNLKNMEEHLQSKFGTLLYVHIFEFYE